MHDEVNDLLGQQSEEEIGVSKPLGSDRHRSFAAKVPISGRGKRYGKEVPLPARKC